jgi:cytochrome c peroxidase
MSHPLFRRSRDLAALPMVAATVSLAWLVACGDGQGGPPTEDELEELAGLELPLGRVPASPTNRVADDPAAAELGRVLFFDERMSSDGTVACVSCHDPEGGFSDDLRVSEGVEGRTGDRHAMPVTTAALQPFLLWDGRADTVWRQPLYALENEREMNFTRVEVAHFIAGNHRDAYEAVFGALPDLTGVPARALPGDGTWEALEPATRDGIQRVFVDVGKAIEAYERKLVCADTRYDLWVRGEAELSADELEGAAELIRSGCTGCHDGPAFSDGAFHNLGLSPEAGSASDVGREEGLAVLLGDELNGAGVFSDDPAYGAERLGLAAAETRTRGSFRTASLRGVGQRTRFGHRGAHTDLAGFIDDTYRNRGGGRGRDGDGDGNDIVGERDPLLDEVNVGQDDAERIAEFLRTLDCPPVAPELLAP